MTKSDFLMIKLMQDICKNIHHCILALARAHRLVSVACLTLISLDKAVKRFIWAISVVVVKWLQCRDLVLCWLPLPVQIVMEVRKKNPISRTEHCKDAMLPHNALSHSFATHDIIWYNMKISAESQYERDFQWTIIFNVICIFPVSCE